MGRRRLVVRRPLRRIPIDRLLTLLGSLPIGVESLVRTALGPWQPRVRVVPSLLVLLALLTIIPVGQALVEIIVRPVTVAELVDRQVGLSTRLVAVDGFALLVPLDADPPPDASGSPYVYHWYPVRDSLQEVRLVLVRSIITTEALRTRSIVARVVDDPAAVDRTIAGVAARGGSEADGVAQVLLIEEEPGQQSVRDLGSIADVGEARIGEVVRVTVSFEDGIATCVGRGDCNARSLAEGIGSWDNLAHDGEGDKVVVRTLYPPSVAPFHGVGHHAQDREAVGRLLTLPLVRGLLGWGHVLQAAHVEHDLSLPIDQLWLGPLLFTAAASVLLIGLRLPYPRFRAHWTRTARSAGAPVSGPLTGRATGRITPPNASPFEIADLPATLRGVPPRGTSLSIEVEGQRREFLIPRDLGGLGGTEQGELLRITSQRPALKVDWFGSNLLLVFEDVATRDDANAMIRETGG